MLLVIGSALFRYAFGNRGCTIRNRVYALIIWFFVIGGALFVIGHVLFVIRGALLLLEGMLLDMLFVIGGAFFEISSAPFGMIFVCVA